MELDVMKAVYRFAEDGDNDALKQIWNKLDGKRIDLENEVIYRGLHISKEDFYLGGIVEEMNDFTHWTFDFKVAKHFVGYMRVALMCFLGVDELSDEFVPVVLRLNKAKDGLYLNPILTELYHYKESKEEVGCDDLDEVRFSDITNLLNEEEIAIHGYDFVIENIEPQDKYYLVDVSQKKRTV